MTIQKYSLVSGARAVKVEVPHAVMAFIRFLVAATLAVLFGLAVESAHAQCVGTGSITSVSAGAWIDNRSAGCNSWNVNYSVAGFTQVYVVIEGAADSSGNPGTPVTLNMTSGNNPNFGLGVQSMQFTAAINLGNMAWVRFNVLSLTGSGTITWNLAAPGPPIPRPPDIITPSKNQHVRLPYNDCPPVKWCYDISQGGFIDFQYATPITYVDSWGGGSGVVATDTAAFNAALRASTLQGAKSNCGTVMFSPSRIYALGHTNPITCGTVDGMNAIIWPSVNNNIFTLQIGSVPVTAEAQPPTIRQMNFQQNGAFVATDLIFNQSAPNAIIERNVFGVISATNFIHTLTYGNKIRDNFAGSGSVPSKAAYYFDFTNVATNAELITGNNCTQLNQSAGVGGVCFLIDGGQNISMLNNIMQGNKGGGTWWNATGNLTQFEYANYHENNLLFDLKFDTNGGAFADAFVHNSGFAGSTETAILMSPRTQLTVYHSIFDGTCVDTSAAISALGTASYHGYYNRRVDTSASCNGLNEGTTAMNSFIPMDVGFINTNDHWQNALQTNAGLGTCSAANQGVTSLISNGAATLTWGGGVGSLGTVWTKVRCGTDGSTGFRWNVVEH